MRTDEVIGLSLLTIAGITGYLLYTKQIQLPKDIIPNPFEKDDKEEKKIVRDLEDESPSESESESRSKGFDFDFNAKDVIGDAFKRGEDILKIPQNFLSDALKRGQEILGGVPKKSVIVKKDEPSLDDLISGALKGRGFRPYSGTAGRPYD